MTTLGLSCEQLQTLADGWNDEGLWNDILWLSLRFWGASDEVERRIRWHHLLMAIGNFKRQTGRRLHPCHLAGADLFFRPHWDSFTVPDSQLLVEREEVESWQALEDSLNGAATATATALLAALWPDRHHVLDWRVLAAAVALTLGQPDTRQFVAGADRHSLVPTMERYAPVREVLLDVARECNVPLSTVERALYRLTRRVTGKGATWHEYGRRLRKAAATAVSDAEPGGDPNDEIDIPPDAP